MNTEQQKIEYKSLQKIRTGEKGFKELSTTCVALANAQGGQIMIGVEDKTKKPAPNQVIPQEEANSAVTRLRGLCFNVGLAVGDVREDETGSQYFAITVFLHSIPMQPLLMARCISVSLTNVSRFVVRTSNV